MSRILVCAARINRLNEEGDRPRAYNDATGKTVTCKPNGNLTIGKGTNLENGLDEVEIDFIFLRRLTLADNAIAQCWWLQGVDDVRGSVALDLAFNGGVACLLHFPKMLAAYGAKNWAVAQTELLNSDAARELPHRYNPLGLILLSGVE